MKESTNFKRLTHNICNFQNICKSLAIRHQVNEYHEWKDCIPTKSPSFPGCKVESIPLSWNKNTEFEKLFLPKYECMQSMSAVIRGTKFCANDVLISDVSFENFSSPVFVLVQKILILDNRMLVEP